MIEAIRHRGPDDEGRRVSPASDWGCGGLTSSIWPPATSQSIMKTARCWVVFRWRNLLTSTSWAELAAAGYGSPPHGHRKYRPRLRTVGPGVFERLRGMFGIALWDNRDGSLWLARDRAGIKPLHYAVAGQRLYFGSEIKSILAAGDVTPTLDSTALDHYLSFLYTPRDTSIFRRCRQTSPRTYASAGTTAGFGSRAIGKSPQKNGSPIRR